MILVTLGSQKFQFNRLLRKIDDLIVSGIIQEPVFAQIGESDYIPQNFQYQAFLDKDKFSEMMSKCSILITHGGTGAIINAVKMGKRVIAIPRLAQFGEHVDDHQIQLLKEFDSMGIILACYDTEMLGEMYSNINNQEFQKYISNTTKIINNIEAFINSF